VGEPDVDRVGSADRVPVREIGPEALDVGLRVAPDDRVVVREEEIVAVPDFVGWTDTEGVDVVVVVRVPDTDFVAALVELDDRVEETVPVPVAVCVELRVPDTDRVWPADLEDVREPDAEVDGLRVPVVVRVEVMVDEGDRVPVVVRESVVERVLVREADTVAVAVCDCIGVRVVVVVRVMVAVPEAVCVALAEGVDGMVGLGDLEGNPERVAVRVVVGVIVGIIFTAAS
jgi:hypothetical protein